MYILLLACQRQVVQSLMDEPIVVVTRDLVIAPEIEPEQIVETQRGLFPLLVRLGMPEDVEPELRGSLAAPPGEEPLVSKMVASAWSHVVMFARSTVSEYLLTRRQKSKISTITAHTPTMTVVTDPMFTCHCLC